MNFAEGKWTKEIDVRDFILANYTPYDGDESFLASPTENTQKLWEQLSDKMKIERDRGGVYDRLHLTSPAISIRSWRSSWACRQTSH